MKRILTAILCACICAMSLAQNATILSAARSELSKRGLTEAEVRERLLENGIDVDTIQPSEYAAYQDRVTAILDQMQAEKDGKAGKGESGTARQAGTQTGTQAGTQAGPQTGGSQTWKLLNAGTSGIPVTTDEEALAEQALADATAATDTMSVEVKPADGSDIYGHALFTSPSLDVFRTTDGAQAPDTYVLGEGDEVHISIFGSSQTDIRQRIDADGSIHPAGAGKIFLKGMTLAQAREAIRSKLAGFYSFRPDQIAVTIATARTLSVNIYGEVAVQGGFTMSALNTAFNALVAAGGPTAIGSLRNIQRSRAGQTTRLDFYSYMTGAASSVLYDLQNNDVLFVPVAEKIVRIEGAVARPMRYEMLDSETLVDLIRFAGGLTEDAYPEFVQVERYEDGLKSLLEFNLRNVMSGSQKVGLVAGDIVRVRPSTQPLENYVEITGDVYYDGRYDLARNGSLRALIESAKPRYTARTEFVFVERMHSDETVEVLTVPFPGINGNPDFALQPRDLVRVLGQVDYRDVEDITVSGRVRQPFSRPFGYDDWITVGQAIEYAGGLMPTVYPVAFIFRKDLTNPERMEYISINLNTDSDVRLQPGDELRIYDNTTYTNIGELRVSGAVKEPQALTFDPGLTVHDLLVMAGGFTVGAAYNRVEVFRVNISKTDQVSYNSITLSVDEDYNVVGGDFQLQPYDHVVVRMTPNFGLSRSVEINGRVRFPGTYVLEDSRTQLSKIIKMAGGLLDDADPYASLFRTYNNRGSVSVNLDKAMGSGSKVNQDPILMDGDVINVLRQENTVTIYDAGTRMSQFVEVGVDNDRKHVVYQGVHSAAWYIRHFAGGFDKVADRNSVTVTMPNGQVEGTRRILFFRNYPGVTPGSTIALRNDPDKERELLEPKEKVDWDQVYSRVITSITSISTIVLLIENLKRNNNNN